METPQHKSNYSSNDFAEGEILISKLKQTLKYKRHADLIILDNMGLDVDELHQASEKQMVDAFNQVLDSGTFFKRIDPESLDLPKEIRSLVKLAEENLSNRKPMDRALVRTMNRALLQALYPDETARTRRFSRFSWPEMERAKVTLSSLPPYEPYSFSGKLMNISMGGMALLLEKPIAPNSLMALRIEFMDQSEMETIVQFRHSVKKGDDYVCGFEFVSIPSYMSERINQFGFDFMSCEDRIKAQYTKICRRECSLFTVCRKPQHI